MRSFRRLAFITVLAVYFLIFIGGLVRVAGAGLGCPDWPKCFGRWIPPLSVADIPPEIDPSRFNITLAWIEYGNRLIGMSVGLLVLATALLALKVHRRESRILYPSLLAALLTAYQGWQGGQVVASELKPIIVSAHLFISFVIVSILIYVAQQSRSGEQNVTKSASRENARVSRWVALLWGGGLVQIVLGTFVRGKLQVITEQMPNLADTERLAHVGIAHDLHMISGTLVALATVVVGMMILRVESGRSTAVKPAVIGLMGLAFIQIGLGFYFLVFGLSPVLQLFHLWASGLFIGISLALYLEMKYPTAQSELHSARLRKQIVVAIVVVIMMALGAAWVVQQAELSRMSLA